MCNEQVHAAGAPAYKSLANCILCVNCYTACEPGAQGTCPAPPAMKGPCDTGTFGQTECQTCQQCSVNVACHSALAACQNNPDCVALATDLGMCPT